MKNNLNILHISPDFNYVCGVSKYIYLVLKELKSQEESLNVKIHFITNKGDSLERLESIGIKPYLIRFEKGLKNVLNIKRNLKELEKYCIENKINVIHTHHRYPEYLSNFVKKKLNIKTITTVHSLVNGYKYFSFKSDKIIAVSKAVENNIKEKYNVKANKIIQVYNPIDFDEYKNYDNIEIRKSSIGLPENSKVFAFIGRWDKIKGVDMIIKVFNEIIRLNDKVYLLIISDIPQKEKQKIQNLSKNIILISPTSNIIKFYKLADIIVLPSKKESFPFVMLEAGLLMKLFIGSRVDGIAEFIFDRKDGLLFKPNEESFKATVLETLKLPNKEINLIVNNLNQKVRQLENPSIYSQKLLNVYLELLNS